jgi:hypothetical protein
MTATVQRILMPAMLVSPGQASLPFGFDCEIDAPVIASMRDACGAKASSGAAEGLQSRPHMDEQEAQSARLRLLYLTSNPQSTAAAKVGSLERCEGTILAPGGVMAAAGCLMPRQPPLAASPRKIIRALAP